MGINFQNAGANAQSGQAFDCATGRTPAVEFTPMSPPEPPPIGSKPTHQARKIFVVVAIVAGIFASFLWVAFLGWVVIRLAVQLHF